MSAANIEVKGETRVDLTTTCSLVGCVTRLKKQADGGSDDRGEEKYDVRDVHAFLGVPYAKPPVGDLMFKDPVPLELWQGDRQATEFGPACPQNMGVLQFLPIKFDPPAKVSEDCLYLNVWTPNKSSDAKLPVMVYFYGGAFISGFTDMYRGDVLVNFHDVVVVTVGYRIGLWGFLCTGDSAATGNYGLLDQVEALRWVNKYIKNFGGDPNNVTLFGQSAGGASTAFHSVSPLSRGLFKNVISQSGTLIVMGEAKKPQESLEMIKPYLKYLGCEATSGEEIVSFLRSQPADKLVMPLELMKDIFFVPVIDGKFITDRGSNILASGNLPKQVNQLMGVTNDEGAFAVFAIAQMMKTEAGKLDKEAARTLLQGSMKIRFSGRDTGAFVDALMEEYVKDSVASEELIQALIELSGDVVFVCPAIQTADAHAGISPVYFYTFEKRSGFVKYPEYIKADHGCDVPSVFGQPYLYPDVEFSAEDRALSRKIMSYWTNFAKTGNPNGVDLEEWPVYTVAEKKHLVLDHPITQSANYKAERIKFLKEAIAKFL